MFEKQWILELLKRLDFGLTFTFFDNNEYRRNSVIILDNLAELAMWNYLKYEKRTKPPENNFHKLVKKTETSTPKKTDKGDLFQQIAYYHEQRNHLYHLGTTISQIEKDPIIKQCIYTFQLFKLLFGNALDSYEINNYKFRFMKAYIELEYYCQQKELKTEGIEGIEDIKQSLTDNVVLPFRDISDDDFNNLIDNIEELKNRVEP